MNNFVRAGRTAQARVRTANVGASAFDAANAIFLIVLAIVTLYPLWYVMVGSLLPYDEAIRSSFNLYPKKVTLDAYRFVFGSKFIMNGFLIAIVVTIGAVVYQLLITSAAAYSLTKRDLPLRNAIFLFFILTMFASGGLIPTYLLIKSLNLMNNLLVMIIPSGISVFNLIVMKTFIQSLPKELEESALIDGAGYAKIWLRVILPLSGPVLATVGLFVAVGQWNNWMTPMMYLQDKSLWPLAMVLRDILVEDNKFLLNATVQVERMTLDKTIKNAVIIVSIVPIMLVYPFIQKHFAKGVMIGAIKS
ncbi:putative aldouronate transport system permease protein [Cohnella sp. SGD-V74]|uniref:carbohydrate ABC transporter permease n=1 Tax=unclassified Cohnella TaxID=2636738 RepID=UPI000B8BF258|nr:MULTISPECIES: carbohydrate ABC transporter permease [unclassified Cohnella]PRX73812.1 putative aldouronate transport system permease protein [Cohnella sp. SGD-V74]